MDVMLPKALWVMTGANVTGSALEAAVALPAAILRECSKSPVPGLKLPAGKKAGIQIGVKLVIKK